MYLVDANVLLNATNRDAREHPAAKVWLSAALRGHETVAFAWIALLAFVRVGTSSLFPTALTADQATGLVGEWLSQPNAVVLNPTTRHLDLLRGLLAATGTAANLTNDAHLAALALEHGATIVSFDRDFGRFTGVEWRLPVNA